MAAMIYLDTHVVVWLYAKGASALSKTSSQLLEQENDIRISPMTRMELQYLKEIKRINQDPIIILDSLDSTIGLSICNSPFPLIVKEAENNAWTRDPFDRLIVAQASLNEAPLITKDEIIHANYPAAIW